MARGERMGNAFIIRKAIEAERIEYSEDDAEFFEKIKNDFRLYNSDMIFLEASEFLYWLWEYPNALRHHELIYRLFRILHRYGGYVIISEN